MTSALLPLIYQPPLAAPARGLYDAVNWVSDGSDTARFLATGVDVQQVNTRLDEQVGVWGESWCVDPDAIESTKAKDRLDNEYANFSGLTVYGFDHNQCGDMTEAARTEVRARALNALTLNEQLAVETSLAARLIADATPVGIGGPDAIVQAVGHLEYQLAKTGLTGYLHVSPRLAAYLTKDRLIAAGRSPLGHTWVFGNGYADTLQWRIIATTQPVGWRGAVEFRDAYKYELDQYVAVAERSVLVAYETVLAAVDLD